MRFRDYGNSEDVALADLRAKGDDRDAVIAQLRADLAAQPRSSEDALRDTELASLRAELASCKDAEQRASLLEETVASQAEEIRRLSEAKPPDASAVFGAEPDAARRDAEQRAALLEETVASQAEEIRRLTEAAAAPAGRRGASGRRASAVFGAAPADAAGLFGAPPADDGVVDELKKRIQELEANDASEARGPRRRGVRNYSDGSGPWKRRTQMLQVHWRRPTNACRRSAPRARPTRRRYSQKPSSPSSTSREGSAGSCGSRRRTFRGR